MSSQDEVGRWDARSPFLGWGILYWRLSPLSSHIRATALAWNRLMKNLIKETLAIHFLPPPADLQNVVER